MSLKADINLYKLRKEQKEALDFIDSEYKSNPLNKFFLLNLPTGVGKSVLAINIADWYKKNVDKTAKIDIITSNKILQNQYSETFSSISDLKGKENYECQQYSTSCAQGSEFNRLNKTSCENCPYKNARESFISGGISLTNFHLYILYAMYNKKILESRGGSVLIVDECLHPDTLIAMSDGSFKMIKDIEVNDYVKTINEETLEIEDKPVLKVHFNLNKGEQMYEIEMENGDVVKITGNHKVRLVSGSWKRVDELNESDEILSLEEN